MNFKRIMAGVLSICMAVTLLSGMATSLAADGGGDGGNDVVMANYIDGTSDIHAAIRAEVGGEYDYTQIGTLRVNGTKTLTENDMRYIGNLQGLKELTINVPIENNTIPDNTFRDRSSLIMVHINDVTIIGNYAFYGCVRLQSFNGGNITTIGNSAFENCGSLQGFELSHAINIGNYAFKHTGLFSAYLTNVETIGDEAFYASWLGFGVMLPELAPTAGSQCFGRSLEARIYTTGVVGKIPIGATGYVDDSGNPVVAGENWKELILTKPIEDMTITVEDVYSYTGGDAEPTVTVKDGEAALVENSNYSVIYSNNDTTGRGTARITPGHGLYGAPVDVQFTISEGEPPAPPSSGGDLSVAPPSINVANEVIKQTVVVLKPAQTNSVIYYTLDDTTPTINSLKYEKPLILKADTTIKFFEVGTSTSAVIAKEIKVRTNTVSFIGNAGQTRYITPVFDTLFAPDKVITRYDVLESLYKLLQFGTGTIDTEFDDVRDEMKQVVAYFQSADIVNGFGDGTFKGERGLTRAEFVKIMAIILKLEVSNTASAYPDAVGNWAEKYIAEFTKLGYLKGYPDGNFYPDRQMTRAEFVTIVNRIIGTKGTSASQMFTDVPSSHWAYGDIMSVCGQ